MKRETRKALLDLMILTDEYDLLRDDDENPKDYKDRKKQAYYELMAFIKKHGDK